MKRKNKDVAVEGLANYLTEERDGVHFHKDLDMTAVCH